MALSGDQIAQAAQGYAGKPYVWGGATPAGWDCSGFSDWLLNIHLSLPIPGEGPGTNVPHGPVVSDWLGWSGCTTVTDPAPGDLICWGPNVHMGFVTGNNEMISALNPQLGTIATSFTGGSPGGSPTFLRLNGTTPGTGTGGGTSDSAAATGGLDAADTAQLVAAGCLPGSVLVYTILMRGSTWTSNCPRPGKRSRSWLPPRWPRSR